MKKTLVLKVIAITPGSQIEKDKDGKITGSKTVVSVRLAADRHVFNLANLSEEDAAGLSYGQELPVTVG